MTQAKIQPQFPQVTDKDYQKVLSLLTQNKGSEAKFEIEKLLKKHPKDSRVLTLQGTFLRLCGELQPAIETLSHALGQNDGNWEALYQLGLVMVELKQPMQAAELLEATLFHKPLHLETLEQLKVLYMGNPFYERSVQLEELGAVLTKIVQAQPTHLMHWEHLRLLLEQNPQLTISSDFVDFLTQYIQNTGRLNVLVSAVAGWVFLFSDPHYHSWGRVFGQKSQQDITQGELSLLLTQIENPLLQALLTRSVVALADFEFWIQRARYTLLAHWKKQTLPLLGAAQLAGVEKLAIYYFRIEYLPQISPEEKTWLNDLQSSFAAQMNPQEILLLSLYQPLAYLPTVQAVALSQMNHPALNKIIRITYIDYLTEWKIAEKLSKLGSIGDEISQKVQEQYEENPYPRWDSAPTLQPFSPPQFIYKVLPFLSKQDISVPEKPTILIAGCGTGLSSAVMSTRFPKSPVLNIDLSRASLAYAKRKLQELKLDKNAEFMQADILNLEQLNRTFDIIESMGVLHHMQDPMAGWKVLTTLLNKGGLISIGLYSQLARKDVSAAREEITTQGYLDTLEDMQRFRAEILNGAPRNCMKTADFFTTSNFRDLIFHRNEHQFTLPQIAEALNTLGLKFLGFIETGNIYQCFKSHHGDAADFTNLDQWHQLEQKIPNLFFGMYQFWCYKPR